MNVTTVWVSLKLRECLLFCRPPDLLTRGTSPFSFRCFWRLSSRVREMLCRCMKNRRHILNPWCVKNVYALFLSAPLPLFLCRPDVSAEAFSAASSFASRIKSCWAVSRSIMLSLCWTISVSANVRLNLSRHSCLCKSPHLAHMPPCLVHSVYKDCVDKSRL